MVVSLKFGRKYLQLCPELSLAIRNKIKGTVADFKLI